MFTEHLPWGGSLVSEGVGCVSLQPLGVQGGSPLSCSGSPGPQKQRTGESCTSVQGRQLCEQVGLCFLQRSQCFKT